MCLETLLVDARNRKFATICDAHLFGMEVRRALDA